MGPDGTEGLGPQLRVGDGAQVHCGDVVGTGPQSAAGHLQMARSPFSASWDLSLPSSLRLCPKVMGAGGPASCSWGGARCQVWGPEASWGEKDKADEGTELLFTVVLGTCWQGPADRGISQPVSFFPLFLPHLHSVAQAPITSPLPLLLPRPSQVAETPPQRLSFPRSPLQ